MRRSRFVPSVAIVEWPEVITEGVDIEDCRVMLQDALKEMILASPQVGQTIPGEGSA